ncbi:hypothetical protein PVAND_006120 [Polypedilum vanderplanki]|uniref:Uncharacterized protein n=1 Tax=Polypedilum vanderplanki TaxID=319348 RepID=A0A9J6C316_POLVA|nr:hypothetical protein PVAND_006120 [Polypedilum vanderplanki]
MWTISLIILTLQLCGELSGHSIYRGYHNNDMNEHVAVPVNQHTMYTKEYGHALHDLASYKQKLEQQGLFQNPPFILTNNANDLAYQFPPQHQQNYQQHNGEEKGIKKYEFIPSINLYNENKQKVSEQSILSPFNNFVTQTQPTNLNPLNSVLEVRPVPPNRSPFKSFNNFAILAQSNSNPLNFTLEVRPAPPNRSPFKTFNKFPTTAQPATLSSTISIVTTEEPTLVSQLNTTIKKIGENIDLKINVIKLYVEKSMKEINKLSNGVYQQVGNKTSRIFKAISMKLEKMEQQLLDLSADSARQINEIHESEETKEEKLRNFEIESEEDEKDEEELENIGRSLFSKPNVIDSEAGKKLIEFDKIDTEMRNDFKSSISNAIKQAHDKFNHLIENQINRVNNKISKMYEKLEAMMAKLKRHQPADVTDDYTTIHWYPKTSTTAAAGITTSTTEKTTTPAPKLSTTPDYFKYTIQSKSLDDDDENNNIDLWKRMDTSDEDETTTIENKFPLKLNPTTPIIEVLEESNKNELENFEQHQVNDVIEAVKEELRSELQMSSNKDKLLENSIDVDDDDKIEESTESELNKDSNQPEIIEGGEENDLESNDEEDDDEQAPVEFDENVKSTGNDTEMPSTDDDEEEEENAKTEIPSIDEVQPIDASKTFHFDELEVIQLIPIIIEQLRQNHVTENEKSSLEKIFGDSLWSLMLTEALRNQDADEMNPLLRTILSSEEVRLAKRDIQAQIGNDIYKNSLRRIYRGKVPSHGLKPKRKIPYISFDDDRKLLSPSERLLNMIAAIVHKSNVMEKEKADAEARLKEKRKYARKNFGKKKQLEKKIPLGIVVPRQRYVDRILSTNRMKRSIIKFGTDLADMKALLDQVNNQENDSNEEKQQQLSSEIEDDIDDDDDYMNDDYYMDDEEEEENVEPENVEIGWFSKTRRSFYDDYEDGSVNEFINLARQRDRREKNFMPQLHEDTNEYDEEDEVYDDEN